MRITCILSVDSYLPTLSESQVSSADVSFGADAKRRTLFQDKTFIFLSPLQVNELILLEKNASAIFMAYITVTCLCLLQFSNNHALCLMGFFIIVHNKFSYVEITKL